MEILVALMLAQARECLYEKLLLQIESFSISNKNHVSESTTNNERTVCMHEEQQPKYVSVLTIHYTYCTVYTEFVYNEC